MPVQGCFCGRMRYNAPIEQKILWEIVQTYPGLEKNFKKFGAHRQKFLLATFQNPRFWSIFWGQILCIFSFGTKIKAFELWGRVRVQKCSKLIKLFDEKILLPIEISIGNIFVFKFVRIEDNFSNFEILQVWNVADRQFYRQQKFSHRKVWPI